MGGIPNRVALGVGNLICYASESMKAKNEDEGEEELDFWGEQMKDINITI